MERRDVHDPPGKIVRVDMFFLADNDSVSETVRSLAEGGLGAEAVEEPAH
jgi:hypothetical protein